MSTLILCLPSATSVAIASYDYVVTSDGRTLTDYASVPLALLPRAERGDAVVAVIPMALLSWHSVELPAGINAGSPRLRPILEGLLEDRLLDEPEQLHLALAPQVIGRQAWVAACDGNWLRGHLQALEAAHRPVTRIVPEFAPDAGALHLYVVGEPERPELVLTGASVGGVLRLPLTTAALALVPANQAEEELLVLAEPQVAALAESFFQRKVVLMTRPQRCLDAARSPWDMAQFDLASSGRARMLKRLSSLLREWRLAPAWQPARWGLAIILLANLLGLNAWAWKEQSSMQARRAAVQGALTQTFPQIKVVVDAPLQMEREVVALRRAAGLSSGRDLEAILAVLGAAIPADRPAAEIEFMAGAVRVKGLQLSAAESAGMSVQLKRQGYNARQEGASVLIEQKLTP